MWRVQGKAEREKETDGWISREQRIHFGVLGNYRLFTAASQRPPEIQMPHLLDFQELVVQEILFSFNHGACIAAAHSFSFFKKIEVHCIITLYAFQVFISENQHVYMLY